MLIRTLDRIILLLVGIWFLWDAPSRAWWWRQFKNGSL